MAVSLQLVRKLALALPGVTEGVCLGTAAFYCRKKLLLRLREDGETLVVKFPPAARAAAIQADPEVLSVTEHYRDHPVVLVSLLAVRAERLEELITGGWRMLASGRQLAELERPRRAGRPPME